MMKRSLSLLLCAAMALSLLAGCGKKDADPAGSVSGSQTSSSSQTPVEQETIRFKAMSGPTGMGAAKLMKDFSLEAAPADSSFALESEIVADNSAIKDALIGGTADIAAVATNMAAVLSNKTEGAVQVLAVNTLGVLYILEKGDTVHSMADLSGKTLYAIGQGANPEYVLNYLLTKNGVNPADVDIQFLTPQEITAKMASGEEGICMLPVPAATALMMKDQNVRAAVSLSDAWEELDEGSLPQGCIVARTEFVEAHPELVEDFLDEYEDSIEFMNDEDNRAEAAALVAEYGIAPNDKVAAKAIPQASLTFVEGDDMKDMLEAYYTVLFEANPASIGGSLPYDSFYYGVD